MKKLFFLLIFFELTLSVFSQNDYIGEYLIYHDSSEYYLIFESDTFWVNHNNITIKFKDPISAPGREAFGKDYNLALVRETSGSFYNYNLSQTSNFISVCDSIYYDERVDKINFGFKVQFYSYIPDDDEVINQWYLEKIDAFRAWDITMGKENITVAVIDEGLFLEHDDIGYDDIPFENIFHNPDEDEWSDWEDPTDGDGVDGIENANPPITNGKIDDWKGWNYRNFIPTPNPHVIEDNSVIPEVNWGYHGTAVSGIIAAKTNNSIYMAGIAGGNYQDHIYGVKILPLKITDWRIDTYWNQWVQETSSEKIAAAIDYASEEMGVNIINMSFGVNGPPSIMDAIKASLENAYDNYNVLLVAAAGNEGYNGFIPFPASDSHVIAVGATDQDDERADFSNCGDEMELSAPGVDIVTLDNTGVSTFEGTSFSSPMVAATAALMLSINPDLTNEQTRIILQNTAEKVGSDSYVDGWNCTHGFGRINTYYAVCEAIRSLQQITVNTTRTWDSPVISLHDIIVESGVTLTITSTVYMGSEARFIIESGAVVIVNQGLITNYKFCGEENLLWPGFQVWGTSDSTQNPLPNHLCRQGKLILESSTIENAVTAVDLWRPGYYNMTGGIIDANNSTFKNNAKSIHALNYRNFHPVSHTEMDYYGNFTNCTFTLDEEFLNDKTFYKHVDLAEVKGLKFYGCTFNLDPGLDYVSEWNDGIAAYDAGFTVLPICLSHTQPCNEYDSCRFTGFYNAIKATSSSQVVRTFFVNSAVFTDNTYGIYVDNVNSEIITFCRFNIGDNHTRDTLCCRGAPGTGIYATSSSGFAFEENLFKLNGNPNASDNFGIWVYNCDDVNTIYKNHFDGLSYGNYAQGQNTVSGNAYLGLTYFCNCDTNNYTDFYVSQPSTIALYQGNDNLVTGNTFSPNANMHFDNNGPLLVGYYYSNYFANQNPDDNKIDHITDKGKNLYNNCESHYGGHSKSELVLNEEDKLNLEQIYYDNLINFNNVKSIYENLKDGGNTENELNEIQVATPEDMWELRSNLLGESPHLSLEVLKAVADRSDVFTESAIFDILSANPDELKKEELLKYLEEKENPLPEYMIVILREVAEGTTYKTVLQQQMSYYNYVKTRTCYDMIRSILNDTVLDYTELRNGLDNLGGLRADKQIIASFIEEKNFEDALELATLLPQLYELDEQQLMEHSYYLEILNLFQELEATSRNTFQLDSNEEARLLTIADISENIAGSMARSILESGYGYHFYKCPNMSDTSMYKSGIVLSEALNQLSPLVINAKPNPANQWVAFDYVLPNDESQATFIISDLSGNTIKILSVSGQQGQLLWDSREVNPGTYLYTLRASGYIKTGKITIIN